MATKRKDDWASQVPAGIMGAGGGPDGSTAYDQTQGAAGAAPAATPPPAAGPGAQQPVPDAPVGLLADVGQSMGSPASTDQLTGDQLAQLDPQAMGQTSGGTPDQVAFDQMNQILQDPNAPPEVKAQVEQAIELAARKSMLGG